MRSYKLLSDWKWGWKKNIHGFKSTPRWKLPASISRFSNDSLNVHSDPVFGGVATEAPAVPLLYLVLDKLDLIQTLSLRVKNHWEKIPEDAAHDPDNEYQAGYYGHPFQNCREEG